MSPSNPADFSPATWDYAGEIACIALFFWDWVITLDEELRYSSFALMCFATYTFTLRDESQSMSNVEVWIRVISMILIIILVQTDVKARAVILQLRVYIMYNRSRTLLRLNGAFFVFELAVTVALLAVFSQRIQYLPLSLDCGECIIWPRELGYCYVVPLIFEAYLATLMVKRSWENRRLFGELEGQSLFYVLVRDSVVYFFLVLGEIHGIWGGISGLKNQFPVEICAGNAFSDIRQDKSEPSVTDLVPTGLR
ncbi:hypothetical protein EXIGLDRAFT_694934 [Exidia glandulosa HHB12029]|uniref:Uncharacterized protein n=1 Tax=Exidia glandulosa HHB12029 TaxID=1314781 RepID=A0A165G9J4_EXIGL|nr:hypothetical protein EXIGLDRAFT_694934 [Exidia glandulosa HHB12029]